MADIYRATLWPTVGYMAQFKRFQVQLFLNCIIVLNLFGYLLVQTSSALVRCSACLQMLYYLLCIRQIN